MTTYSLKTGETVQVDIVSLLLMSDAELRAWEDNQLGKHFYDEDPSMPGHKLDEDD